MRKKLKKVVIVLDSINGDIKSYEVGETKNICNCFLKIESITESIFNIGDKNEKHCITINYEQNWHTVINIINLNTIIDYLYE